MIAYGKPYFKLWRIDKGQKESRYETLLRYKRQTGKIPSELKALPDLPIETAYLWKWFIELHQARREHGGPMIWSDINAYLQARKIDAAPWELDGLLRLDVCYRVTLTEKEEVGNAMALQAISGGKK